MRVPPPTAALAGVPAGLQAQGVWSGRRQLFVRFAAEAETATMYTAAALRQEIGRLASRAAFHSVAIAGRDPLANADFLAAVFDDGGVPLPVMLDVDGQRPEEASQIVRRLALLQVTLDGVPTEPTIERALATIRVGAERGVAHALVLCADERTSDGQLLRIVEQAHGISAATSVVVHPAGQQPIDRDRRWVTLIERAAALHGDVRLMLRLPPPVGLR
ncbi:MAG TPA: hypothetical protein VEA99_07395 [Gemmatimonadaceae bacterium]|nr:hypothetical protein [Gemmatimonadaceae bacterium]